MTHFFEDGGFTMIPILLLGFCVVGASALDTLRPSARLRGVVLSLSAAVGAGGVLGFVMAVIATLRGSQQVDEGDRMKVIVGGLAESANNLVLALVFLLLVTLISAVGAVRNRHTGSATA